MKLQRIILVLVALTFVVTGCFRKQAPQASVASPSPTPTPRILPTRNGSINDYANVLSAADKKRLDSLLAKFLRERDAEFAIATIETTNGEPLFDYSLALARDWKVGTKSGRGLLLVLAIKDRQWRLQITKALEPELPDAVTKELGDRSAQFYKRGEWVKGIEQYVKAIGEKLKRKPALKKSPLLK